MQFLEPTSPVSGMEYGRGEGRTKGEAGENAAREALQMLRREA